MSKLNDEIIDVLLAAHELMEEYTPPIIHDAQLAHKILLERTGRLLTYHLARREVEDHIAEEERECCYACPCREGEDN